LEVNAMTESQQHHLGPLILRLALGAVFLYHGLDKVTGEDNAWGATWATAQWNEGGKPPRRVDSTLEGVVNRAKTNLNAAEKALASLEKDTKKSEEDKQKEKKKIEESKKTAETILKAGAAIRGDITSLYVRTQGDNSKEVLGGLDLLQLAVAWGEVLCAAALILGVLTRLSAALMALVQVGAIASVTYVIGFSAVRGIGYEFNLVLIAVCLTLVVQGPGMWSFDTWRSSKQKPKVAVQPQEPVPA